jgi:hypothetical protein
MAMDNAYVAYKDLVGREEDGRDCLKIGHVVQGLAQDLCQWEGGGIVDACCKSSSTSVRHGLSERIFVGVENLEQQEICSGIIAAKAHTCNPTIKHSGAGAATVEAAMVSASEFAIYFIWEVHLEKYPG